MALLRDILIPQPRILFVGINPSLRSEQVGHHFASPGNPFWRLLYAARLVDEELKCEDDNRLGEFGLAITNLCARATRSAAELRPDEIKRGHQLPERKIRRVRPKVAAFVAVTIYRSFFGITDGEGPGLKDERIGGFLQRGAGCEHARDMIALDFVEAGAGGGWGCGGAIG